jgi:hypothetical protein
LLIPIDSWGNPGNPDWSLWWSPLIPVVIHIDHSGGLIDASVVPYWFLWWSPLISVMISIDPLVISIDACGDPHLFLPWFPVIHLVI